jgi:hypothetical protein
MKAVYKCRLCGETYTNGTHTGAKIAERCMIYMHVGLVDTQPQAPTKTDTHRCGGSRAGCLGMADFQGWEKEVEDENGQETEHAGQPDPGRAGR